MTHSARWSLIVTLIALAVALPQYFTEYRSAPPRVDHHGNELAPHGLVLALNVVTRAEARRSDIHPRYDGLYAPAGWPIEMATVLGLIIPSAFALASMALIAGSFSFDPKRPRPMPQRGF